MKVSIADLKALPQQRLGIDFNEKVEGLDAVKPVLGDLVASYSASGLRLSGRVKTLLKLHCDRCLRPYFQALTVEIEERFVPQSLLPNDREVPARELLKSDFVEPLPDNGVLDITDVVYQAVTLATPSVCLCSEECPGPAADEAASAAAAAKERPSAGDNAGKKANEPIDPRWKNLKSLFPNEDSQQNS